MCSGDRSQFWDREAATFDDEADHGLRDPVTREAWRRVLRSVLPEPPADVADLGCGTGSLSVLLATDGYCVVGIDSSHSLVEARTEKRSTQAPVSRSNEAMLPVRLSMHRRST